MLYLPIHDWLREANSGGSTWRERVEEYVDLPQFVTQVAIESFLAENDGLLGYYGMNNFFLYRPAGTSATDSSPGTRTIVSSFLDYSIFERAERERPLLSGVCVFRSCAISIFQVLESAADSSAESASEDTPAGSSPRSIGLRRWSRPRSRRTKKAVFDRGVLRIRRHHEGVCAAAAHSGAAADFGNPRAAIAGSCERM